jgi:hypothetical protein
MLKKDNRHENESTCGYSQSVGLLLRYIVTLHVAGESAVNAILVGSWELDCLIHTIFLLHAGADPSTLPLHAPTAVMTAPHCIQCIHGYKNMQMIF